MTKDAKFLISSLLVAGFFFIFFPLSVLIVVAGILVLTILLKLLQISPLLIQYSPILHFQKLDAKPFVSIQIPVSNEPPQILAQTLQSIKNIDYENYEVIVLDNNTSDKTKIEAIRKICLQLGQKFRFYHVDKLSGYKAGALNLMLKLIHSRAEYIAIIDADYVIKKNFLTECLKPFRDKKIVMVQCPQDYRNVNESNQGMTYEYASFFSFYMNEANNFESALFSGTMGIIRRDVFDKIGLWDNTCITEDTDLGLRMQLQGLKSVYLHKSLGHGFLPIDIKSYYAQRYRWAYGNTQILKQNIVKLIRSPILGFRKKISCLNQLTAWINFMFINVIIIFIALTSTLFIRLNNIQEYTLLISGITVVASLLGKLVLFLIGFTGKFKVPFIIALKSLLTHIHLMWVSSTAFTHCLFNVKKGFNKTNKDPIEAIKHTSLTTILPEIIYGLVFLALGVIAVLTNPLSIIAYLSSFLISFAFLLSMYIHYQLEATLKITRQNL